MNITLKSTLLLLPALLLAACSEDTTEIEQPLRPVRYVEVSPDSGIRSRVFSGQSQSRREVRASFKVSGTVKAVAVQVGDRVQSGQLLAELDPVSYQLQVEQAQASLVQAEAASRNAQSNYQRTKNLYANNNASRNDLDQARSNAESMQASVKEANRRLDINQLNLKDTRLLADDECAVAEVSTEANENVSQGTQVFKLSCGDRIEVKVDVPESAIADIQQGMTAQVSFASVADQEFTATVTEVGVGTVSGSVTFPIILLINESHPQLRAGLAAEVAFELIEHERQGRFIVPAAAVAKDQQGTYVYVLQSGADGQAVVKRRAVKVGELLATGLEIVSGLEAGEQVVSAGVNSIRDGLAVKAAL